MKKMYLVEVNVLTYTDKQRPKLLSQDIVPLRLFASKKDAQLVAKQLLRYGRNKLI